MATPLYRQLAAFGYLNLLAQGFGGVAGERLGLRWGQDGAETPLSVRGGEVGGGVGSPPHASGTSSALSEFETHHGKPSPWGSLPDSHCPALPVLPRVARSGRKPEPGYHSVTRLHADNGDNLLASLVSNQQPLMCPLPCQSLGNGFPTVGGGHRHRGRDPG